MYSKYTNTVRSLDNKLDLETNVSKKYIILGGVIVLLLITLVSLLLFTSGPTAAPVGDVELTWWKTFETSENVQQLIADFEQANPNVRVNYVQKDIATYEQDLLRAFASGQGPDIFSIHNDWLPMQIDKLVPMPDGQMSVRDYKSTFVDVAADDFVKDNRIFASPMNVDVLALYYNKDILSSSGIAIPPKTWEEMTTSVEKITRVNRPGSFLRSGISLGTASNVNRAVDILSLLMLQNGTMFYSPDRSFAEFDQSQSIGSTQFNPGQQALMYYTQFANPAKRSYTWNALSDNSVDAFTQGKLGMMLSYYYMRPQILDKGPTLNWDVAPVPQISVNSVKVNFANYWGEAVYKNSKSVSTAWEFINFITSKEQLAKYYQQHKLVSSRKDILAEQTSDTEIGVFAESALSAKSVYKKDSSGYEAVFAQMIDDVSTKGVDIDEAISTAVQQINLQLQTK